MTAPSSPADSTDAIDRMFSALADPNRRAIIYYLADTDLESSYVTLDDLTDAVTAAEHTSATADLRRELYHQHLPRLAESGILAYEPQTEIVHGWEPVSLPAWIGHDHPELDDLLPIITRK